MARTRKNAKDSPTPPPPPTTPATPAIPKKTTQKRKKAPSLPIRNENCDEDIENTPPPQSSQPAKRIRAEPIQWTQQMSTALVTALVDAVRGGKRSDNSFKGTVWKEVCDAVVRYGGAGTPVDLSVIQCKARNDTLKRKWKIWMRLKVTTGWGCNPDTGALTTTPTNWEMEIKRCPDAAPFRRSALADFNFLTELYQTVTATGSQVVHSNMPVSATIPPATPIVDHNIHPDLRHDSTISLPPIPSQPCLPPQPKPMYQRDRKTPSGKQTQATSASANTVDVVASILETMDRLKEGYEKPDRSCIERATIKFREEYEPRIGTNLLARDLECEEGPEPYWLWTEDDVLIGYEILEDFVKADIFLGLTSGRRQDKWVIRQIGKHSV
ncbi:hypothetical protein BJ508DRAFT_333132 [Ascobolus immersus RN42]|uniref:Myb/SANT-like domain-containing protein n=1 Tax=Ascobolus immersus RN42 TaxID=1160509 RepID=A0A3N4HPE5_ASCIM|nr:hypothetical protein BJ508DRAFT_333132 [Ascobolus immersus RN42]